MQTGMLELGQRWGEGGKLAGSPGVLRASWLFGMALSQEVGLCSSAVLAAGPYPLDLALSGIESWHHFGLRCLSHPPLTHLVLFQLKDNKVFDVPVAVIAGNRPNYLYR